jgi:dTDP-4-amino-4,6-dideoxygalactose transaminase
MYRGRDEDYPVASRIGDTGLSLPTYPELPLETIDEIATLVLDCCAQQAHGERSCAQQAGREEVK